VVAGGPPPTNPRRALLACVGDVIPADDFNLRRPTIRQARATAPSGIRGLISVYRTGRISAALRVGFWSGPLRAGIVFVTGMSTVILFHGALMRDPSNLREFACAARLWRDVHACGDCRVRSHAISITVTL
jgi:hypothetical protein